jgi:hypothetical protein
VLDVLVERYRLFSWTDVVAEEVPAGTQLVVWYNNRQLGNVFVDEVVHVERRV